MNRRYGNETPGQLLTTAILFTAATLAWIFMALRMDPANYTSYTKNCVTAIILAGGIISAVFWKRWFDERKKK